MRTRISAWVLWAVLVVGCGARTGLYVEGYDLGPDAANQGDASAEAPGDDDSVQADGADEVRVEPDRHDDAPARDDATEADVTDGSNPWDAADATSTQDRTTPDAADAEPADTGHVADAMDASSGLDTSTDAPTVDAADASNDADATVTPDATTDADAGPIPDATLGPDAADAGGETGGETGADADVDGLAAPDATDASVDACADGTCIAPPSPRLVAPLSGCAVSTHTPTLRVFAPNGFAIVHVDVCADRACANVVWSQDVAVANPAGNTAVQVGTSLSSGYAYWRAYITNSDGTRSLTPTWQFAVLGSHSAPVMSAWNNFHDLEGDGYADLLVYGGPSNLPIQEYRGSAQGITATSVPIGSSTPTWAAAGDVTGDGIADVVAMVADGTGGFDLVTYPGSPAGPQPASNGFAMTGVTLSDPQSGGAFIADVNGDGFGDWVSVDEVASVPSISIFFGSGTGLSSASSQTIALPPGTSTSAFVFYTGDNNADGFADLAVSDVGNGDGGASGDIYFYAGSASGLETSPYNSLTASATAVACSGHGGGPPLGSQVAFEDGNGDGYSDVDLSGTESFCSELQLPGGPNGIDYPLSGAGCNGQSCVESVLGMSGGDINGDGILDVSTIETNLSGFLALNEPSGLYYTPTHDGLVAFVPVNLGSVNGDPRSDFAVAWSDTQTGGQGVTVYYGSASAGSGAQVTTLPVFARPF